jgi:hypothetical protein
MFSIIVFVPTCSNLTFCLFVLDFARGNWWC